MTYRPTGDEYKVLVDHVDRRVRERMGPPWGDECSDCGLPGELCDVWFVCKSGRLCGPCIERVLGAKAEP